MTSSPQVVAVTRTNEENEASPHIPHLPPHPPVLLLVSSSGGDESSNNNSNGSNGSSEQHWKNRKKKKKQQQQVRVPPLVLPPHNHNLNSLHSPHRHTNSNDDNDDDSDSIHATTARILNSSRALHNLRHRQPSSSQQQHHQSTSPHQNLHGMTSDMMAQIVISCVQMALADNKNGIIHGNEGQSRMRIESGPGGGGGGVVLEGQQQQRQRHHNRHQSPLLSPLPSPSSSSSSSSSIDQVNKEEDANDKDNNNAANAIVVERRNIELQIAKREHELRDQNIILMQLLWQRVKHRTRYHAWRITHHQRISKSLGLLSLMCGVFVGAISGFSGNGGSGSDDIVAVFSQNTSKLTNLILGLVIGFTQAISSVRNDNSSVAKHTRMLVAYQNMEPPLHAHILAAYECTLTEFRSRMEAHAMTLCSIEQQATKIGIPSIDKDDDDGGGGGGDSDDNNGSDNWKSICCCCCPDIAARIWLFIKKLVHAILVCFCSGMIYFESTRRINMHHINNNNTNSNSDDNATVIEMSSVRSIVTPVAAASSYSPHPPPHASRSPSPPAPQQQAPEQVLSTMSSSSHSSSSSNYSARSTPSNKSRREMTMTPMPRQSTLPDLMMTQLPAEANMSCPLPAPAASSSDVPNPRLPVVIIS